MNVGCLVITKGKEEGKRYLLKNLSVFEGGRSQGSHIFLKDDSVAYCHFRVYRNDTEYSVNDLGTSKGTLVNGEKVEKMALSPGDVVQVGDVELQFEMVDDTVPGRLASSAPDSEEADSQAQCGGILTNKKASSPALVVIDGKDKGRTFILSGKDRFKIGRAMSSDLKLTDAKISREHSMIEAVHDHHIIVDLDSSNGTVVNGERIKKTVLKQGDYIRLGFTLIKYDRV
jgi:pSer/pThr/pTyr-binding forkhead associated (FHA) protein